MNRVLKILRNAFTAQFVTFLAGVLTSILVRAVFGQVIPLNEGLIAITTICFVVFAIAVLAGIRQEINANLVQSRLSSQVYHALRTAGGDIPLYDPVIEIIASAKESVRAVSLYRPPSLEITPGRKRYYQAIHNLLETKHKKGERFRYERIVQVSKVAHGKLGPDQVDALTFDHCKHLVKLQQQQTSLTIHLRQIPDILGALSLLIVDEREVVFAIPAMPHGDTSDPRALQLGTAVVFTDPDGALAKEMLNLFDDLRLNADPITVIVLDDTSVQPQTCQEGASPSPEGL